MKSFKLLLMLTHCVTQDWTLECTPEGQGHCVGHLLASAALCTHSIRNSGADKFYGLENRKNPVH